MQINSLWIWTIVVLAFAILWRIRAYLRLFFLSGLTFFAMTGLFICAKIGLFALEQQKEVIEEFPTKMKISVRNYKMLLKTILGTPPC